MGLEQTWKGMSGAQKAAVVVAGGIGGLFVMSRLGGGAAGGGEPGENLNILDVRRPTDDINAVGGRDPNAWLLREIFRDLRKDQGTPVVTPPKPPPGAGHKDRIRELLQNKRLNSGLMRDLRLGGVNAAERERLTKIQARQGKIDTRLLDLGHTRQPPPGPGIPPPRTQGGTRGTGIV